MTYPLNDIICAMKTIKKLSDKELIQEFKDLNGAVSKVDCFGKGDVLRIVQIEKEMTDRKIECYFETNFWFSKNGEEIED